MLRSGNFPFRFKQIKKDNLKFLIIQTAFTGDVVLATPIIEKLKKQYPDSQIDFVLRKGNEDLLKGHPFIHHVYVWNKKASKYLDLFRIIREIRRVQYDHVINLQRFASSGFMTLFSGAKNSSGFKKNPLSFFFKYRYPHEINGGKHEIERNLSLIAYLTEIDFQKPKLYPSSADFASIKKFNNEKEYICIAPASVWHTKQLPLNTWKKLIQLAQGNYDIFLLGGASDMDLCNQLLSESGVQANNNLAGKLSYLESAAIMQGARMNFVNDSAPMHMASAMNANVCAIYCSTIPAFGFRPVSDQSFMIEIQGPLYCRPCGIHGFKACPEKHFKCGKDVTAEKIYAVMSEIQSK